MRTKDTELNASEKLKKLEENLYQKASELQAIFNAFPDLFFRMDSEGTILDYKAGQSSYLFARPEVFLGKRMQEVLPGEVGQQFHEAIWRVFRTNSQVSIEYSLPMPNGTRNYEARLVPLFDQEVIAIIRDMTDYKRTQEVLLQANERLEMAQSAARAGVWNWDITNGQVQLSPQLFELFGLDPETTPKSFEWWKNMIHPEDREGTVFTVHQALKNKTMLKTDYRVVQPSGQIRWINGLGQAKYDDQGRPIRMTGISIDVTERKKAEEDLRESEKRYRTLFEESRDAIYISSREGHIIEVNQSASVLFGYTREEMLGLSVVAIYLWPEDRLRFQEKIERDGFVRDYEVKFRKKDETVMECLVTAVARKGNDGTVLGYQGIIRDITERKKAEQEIRRLNKDLVGRTHELEAANKELKSFSYSVSHDLRNPLLAIDGFSRKLVEQHSQNLDAKGKQFLNIIHSQTQHLLQLIDGLLAFSRLEHQDLRRSNIDMSELAKTICNEMKLFSPEHHIQVKIGSLPEAMGDPTMIRQVLVNLLSNAYKFTRPKDGGIIEIGCITKEDQNVYYVKDNGVGFDMQFAGRLFGVFQKLHGQGEFEGTGVGLAIVQRIIIRHGGWIWAEGKVNGGATFYFSLPKRS